MISFYKGNSHFSEGLLNEFRQENVVLFIGSGFSASCGYPTWDQLLQKVECKLDFVKTSFYDRLDNLGKAQYLYDEYSRVDVLSAISDIFRKQNTNKQKEFCNLCNYLSSLPFKIIITTNWDTQIEECFNNNKTNFRVVYKDSLLSSVTYNGKLIIKLHGCINDLDSIVFSESDYYKNMNNNLMMFNLLSTLIAKHTILMIGYIFNDFDFKFALDFVRKSLDKNIKNIYFSLRYSEKDIINDNKLEKKRFIENRGLKTIVINDIKSFMESLSDHLSTIAYDKKERLSIILRENSRVNQCKTQGVILRNMSSFGPIGTPLNTPDGCTNMFDGNLDLEQSCAKNWLEILKKENSRAKLIISVDFSKEHYNRSSNKKCYLARIKTMIDNLNEYENIDIVDIGSSVNIHQYDIYGDFLAIRSHKLNVNVSGYGFAQVFRDERVLQSIDLFDALFNSIAEKNLDERYSLNNQDNNIFLKNKIIERLQNLYNDLIKDFK